MLEEILHAYVDQEDIDVPSLEDLVPEPGSPSPIGDRYGDGDIDVDDVRLYVVDANLDGVVSRGDVEEMFVKRVVEIVSQVSRLRRVIADEPQPISNSVKLRLENILRRIERELSELRALNEQFIRRLIEPLDLWDQDGDNIPDSLHPVIDPIFPPIGDPLPDPEDEPLPGGDEPT